MAVFSWIFLGLIAGAIANSVRGSGAVFLGFGAGGMFTTLEGSNRAPCIVR